MLRLHLLLILLPLSLLNTLGTEAGSHKTPPRTTFYGNAPLNADDARHIQNDTFTIVKTVREMPTPIQALLTPNRKHPFSGMANPGQDFERTDAIRGRRLPFQRLIFAAMNAHYCLVYFEQGGFGYSERVILSRLENGRATMRWSANLSDGRRFRTFPELRAAIRNGRRHIFAASSYRASFSRRNSA